MTFLRPLYSRSTYLGWVWLILGGALLMPYMILGQVVISLSQSPEIDGMAIYQFDTFFAVLPLVFLTGLVLPIRQLLRAMVRHLLQVRLEDSQEVASWATRWRTALWYTLHLSIGALLAGATLALVPFAIAISILPLTSDPMQFESPLLESGWHDPMGPLVGVLLLLTLVYVVAGVLAVFRRSAPGLLGPTARERIAAAEAQTAKLEARNRIARQLHDSVGHALSVISIQSEAATRLVETKPESARQAMETSAETARAALEELDGMLGVLRGDATADSAPQRGLESWEDLVASCGASVTASVTIDVDSLNPQVSREAYRIVQECLTNVLRHGSGSAAELGIVQDEDWLDIRVANAYRPTQSPRAGRTGHGLEGIRQRASAFGGSVDITTTAGRWVVRARLPWKGTR
ncbi:sensor histidine kinase [Natronoglycomyces albus]|uniref:histidine kinase n=1 Tax=Natronoglycomyces albus TaxID=2811108 RepID=A0A895XS50_9ACTN|nr:histidine kinase [Natronoglycomyces albus]QSB06343.1 hypothetical protein JQS30_05385 [Natronoglycomyces albus]